MTSFCYYKKIVARSTDIVKADLEKMREQRAKAKLRLNSKRILRKWRPMLNFRTVQPQQINRKKIKRQGQEQNHRKSANNGQRRKGNIEQLCHSKRKSGSDARTKKEKLERRFSLKLPQRKIKRDITQRKHYTMSHPKQENLSLPHHKNSRMLSNVSSRIQHQENEKLLWKSWTLQRNKRLTKKRNTQWKMTPFISHHIHVTKNQK